MSDTVVREFIPSDYNYIISTWIRGLKNTTPLGQEWYDAHRVFINRCLSSDKMVVKILAAADDPNEILSYIVGLKDQLAVWVYTKKAFRNMGLASKLIVEELGSVSTKAFNNNSISILRNMKYNTANARKMLSVI